MTHDLLLLLLLFIYIFVNFCTAHLSETEAAHGSKGEKARERERDCVSVLIFVFLHFLVNVLFSSSEARERAYVILLILIGNKRPQVALSRSLYLALSAVLPYSSLFYSVYNKNVCMLQYKNRKLICLGLKIGSSKCVL